MSNMEKYRQSGTNIEDLSKDEFKQWLDSFDTVLCDCDGVLWVYNNPLEKSSEVVNKFIDLQKRVFLVTNNSTKTREEFLEKAVGMNYKVNPDNVLSTAFLVAQYLKGLGFDKKAFIVGSSGIAKELDAVGIKHVGVGPDVLQTNVYDLIHSNFDFDPEIGAVVVGFDEHISFPKLYKAATYLNNPDVLFVATNTDERFPMPDSIVPGTGSIVRSVETCSERKAFVVGKPNPYICDHIKRTYGIDPSKTLMIGDRCNTDILLGKRCGFQTLMVETGIHKRTNLKEFLASDDPETRDLVPDFYASSLGAIWPILENV